MTQKNVKNLTSSGIYSKLVRVFILQVVFISLITVIGVYTAANVVEQVLMKKALEDEAAHFWTLYEKTPGQPVPNTDNLEGFIAPDMDFSDLPEGFELLTPGFGRVEFRQRRPLVYIEDRQGDRLFLLFDEESVSKLGFYFGVVPLSLALIVIYISAWFAYRQSRKTLSPMVSLADIVRNFDFDKQVLDNLETEHLDTIKTDDEVRTLIDALNIFTRRIRDLVSRERNFTRDASHEMRTPLTVIQGSAEFLVRNDNLDENQELAVQRILRTCRDLNSLVDTLLLLARGEDPSQLTETIVVNDLLQLLVEQINQTHNQDEHLTLNVISNSVLTVVAPVQAVGIVLGNLIRNACNYTPEGKVDIIINKNDVIVADTGRGMQELKVPEYFKPFERGSADLQGGYGLGLDIVRRLCERFGWLLEIEKKEGYSTFIRVTYKP